jgi:hypothetical protein
MPARRHDDLCDLPLVVAAAKGGVILLGPGGVALAMTADAAERSAELLAKAAQRARRRVASKSSRSEI